MPGHRQFDCPNKKPAGTTGVKTQPKTSAVAAAVTGTGDAAPAAEVAAVRDTDTTLEIASPLIRINRLCKRNCKLVALVDTGSPVSFVKDTVYTRYCSDFELKSSLRNLRNLCDQPLDVKGTVRIALSIDVLRGTSFEVDLFVISNTTLEADIIFGREFLFEHQLTVVYKSTD